MMLPTRAKIQLAKPPTVGMRNPLLSCCSALFEVLLKYCRVLLLPTGVKGRSFSLKWMVTIIGNNIQ